MTDFATVGLHGNGCRCPACALRREEADRSMTPGLVVPCNQCGGTGWLQDPDTGIVARMAAEARADHWPDFERRCALYNQRGARS